MYIKTGIAITGSLIIISSQALFYNIQNDEIKQFCTKVWVNVWYNIQFIYINTCKICAFVI